MRRFTPFAAIVLTIVGCGPDERSDSPRPAGVKPNTEAGEANPQQERAEERFVYVDANDNDKVESLPDSSRFVFGRAFTLPIPTAVLVEDGSPDALFHQRWRGNDITIIDGRLYQRLGESDLSRLDSEFTDLAFGVKITREQMDELRNAAEVVGSWSPVRPDSMPTPQDRNYMEVSPSTTFPFHPERTGNILFLYHSKEGLFGNRLVIYARNDQQAADFTVADMKKLLGQDSNVHIPRSDKD